MCNEKLCSRCNETKPRKAFSKNKSKPFGLAEHCRECRSEYRRETGLYFKNRFYHLRFRAKEHGAYDNLTFEQFLEISERKECTYCGEQDKRSLEFEHIHPTRFGGPNSYSSMTLVCKSCNISKGLDDVLTFYERSSKFTEALFNEFLEEYANKNGHSTEEMLDMLRFRQAGERLVKDRKAARRVGT